VKDEMAQVTAGGSRAVPCPRFTSVGRLRDLRLATQGDRGGGHRANLFPFQEIIDWFGAKDCGPTQVKKESRTASQRRRIASPNRSGPANGGRDLRAGLAQRAP
jgi:hypothetical protein